MIPSEISEHIVVAGISPEGKGGVASVIASHKKMLEAFNFVEISASGLAKYYKPFLAIFRSLKYLPKKYKAVHLHTASYKDFYRNVPFVYLFKLMGKKVALHVHGGRFGQFMQEHPALVKKVCRKADALIGVSSTFTDFFKKEGLNGNVYLLHNGIDPQSSPIVRDKDNSDKVVFSYFGAITDTKGIFDVVEAIGRNKDIFKDKIHLYIGGKGQTERLEKLIGEYGISDLVTYLGWLDAEKKHNLLTETDVYVQTSSFESFGISILEAMDYGLPVITTGIGGIPDLVKDGKNGIIVPVGDKSRISEAMLRLADDSELRRNMGAESAKHAKNFYFPKIEKDLKNLYESLLSDK